MTRPARGRRNNNPGNLRHGSDWQGLAPTQPDSRFCTFIAPEWGIRAMCRVLITYKRRHGLDSPRAIVNRWAPPTENDTDAYVARVCDGCLWQPETPVDMEHAPDLRKMVVELIRHELGYQPYDDATIDKGLELAGMGLAA